MLNRIENAGTDPNPIDRYANFSYIVQKIFMQTTVPLSAVSFSAVVCSSCDEFLLVILLANHVFAAALILNWLIVALVAHKLNDLMADKPHSQPSVSS